MGYYVYRYADKTDGIIKYVGIVYGKARELPQRISEHRKDSWHKNGDWQIDYFSDSLLSRGDCEIWESHLIAKYETFKWYNKAKISWGLCSLIGNAEPKWIRFSLDDFSSTNDKTKSKPRRKKIKVKKGIVSGFKLSFYSIDAYKLFLEYLDKFNESTMASDSLELNFPKWLKEQDVCKTTDDFLCIYKSLVSKSCSFGRERLFDCISFCKDKNEQWIFRIKQNKHLNSMILDLKEKCEQYELWETINLKTLNQVKMYERCKQYNHSKNRAYSNLKLISKLSPVRQTKEQIIYFLETP